MTFTQNRPSFALSSPIALGVLLALASVSAETLAQPVPVATTTAPAVITSESAATSMRNGYGENLQPTVRRKSATPSQPYAPIKKQDDQGQIAEIEMFVGESRVFPAPNVGRIAVGNGQIMTAAALDKKEVIVFANGAGTSSLFVWNGDGRYQRIKINIVAGDTSRVAREVAAFLAAIPNAKASIVGDKVIVEGDNLPDADMAKIDQLEKRYPQLVNFTNRIGWEQMVMMDVKVVEFPRSELRDIGLKWGAVGGTTLAANWSPIRFGNAPPGTQFTVNIPSGQAGLPVAAQSSGATAVPLPSSLNLLSGLNLGLSAQLNLLEQEGRASVLAEPQLSARNGAKASFLAGGEFPYSVANINGVTVIFKPYGIKLDISPKVDRNGVIRATIQAEVSSIDGSVSTAGGPALLTRRTDTEFNVRSGETMVLAGLLQRNSSTDIDKVPLLGDLPVLGALFRSKRFQNKETELVIFVTPTVVDSQSAGLVDRVNRTTQRLDQQMGNQPYLSNPLQPGEAGADFNRSPAPAQPARPSAVPPVIEPVAPVVPAASAAPTAPAAPAVSTVPAAAPSPAPVTVVSENDISVVVAVPAPTLQPVALLKVNKPTPRSGDMLQVVVERAQVRAEPIARSQILMQLERGAVVSPGERVAQPPAAGHWRSVMVGSVEGWISRRSVKQTVVNASNTNQESNADY